MTSIRDLVSESLAIGERFCLVVEQRDGTLVADHPHPNAPTDVAVIEGLERLEDVDPFPPSEPIEVEIVGRIHEDRIVGRVVGLDCESPDTDSTV